MYIVNSAHNPPGGGGGSSVLYHTEKGNTHTPHILIAAHVIVGKGKISLVSKNEGVAVHVIVHRKGGGGDERAWAKNEGGGKRQAEVSRPCTLFSFYLAFFTMPKSKNKCFI
jgi:hypothetical protein